MMLIGWVEEGLAQLFDAINREVANVDANVSMSPAEWNGGLWDMATNISDTVILPIAGCVLAVTFCIELISLMQDKNNFHDAGEIGNSFIKFFIKLLITLLFVQNAPKIVSAFFAIAAYIVNGAAGFLSGSTSLDPSISAAEVAASLQEETLFAVASVLGSLFLIRFILFLVSILIQVIVVGRMIEIYIYCSLAPIPISLLSSSTTKDIGINYLKSLAALALQSFLIMVCVGIYAVLVQQIQSGENIKELFWQLQLCVIVLAYSLFKTGQMAKSIFTAH